MFVPALCEASLDVALAHVKDLPKSVGAVLTDKNSNRHVKVGTLVAAALHTVRVEGIFKDKLLKELSLLRRLTLQLRDNLWWLDVMQEWILWQKLMGLLLWSRRPSWL